VWCNPPYGNEVKFWADKLVKRNDGIMLIFARIETKVWHELLFPKASGFFVPNKRIIFCYPDGTPARNEKGNISSAGAPSIFVAFGDRCKDALLDIYDKQLMEGVFIPSIPKRRTNE
jgi:hypothetical protein